MVFRGKGGPPPVDDGLDPEAVRAAREAVCAEYFASLPTDSFTEEEEDLRAALQVVLSETGNVRLSIAAQRDEVRAAKQNLNMPQGVGLGQWLTQRAGDDFALVTDPNVGEKLLCMAGSEHQVETGDDALEDFFASLPDDTFTQDEAVLREQVLLTLRRLGGRARFSMLTRGQQSQDVQRARHALLPKGAPLKSWIVRRLDSEVSVEAEEQGGYSAFLLPAGRSAAASLQRGITSGANAPSWTPQPQQPRLPPPGHKDFLSEEDREASREQAKADKLARTQEFFDTLPRDALVHEEQVLRKALLLSIEKHSEQTQFGVQARLSRVCQVPEVRDAKVALLPDEVTVASWIESRIGGEIVLSKDNFGQVVCERATDAEAPAKVAAVLDQGVGPVLKQEREARMEEYFQGHPNLSVLERILKDSLLEAVAKRHDEAPVRLSHVLNTDPVVQNAWKSAKAAWLQMSPPLEVSFARWGELRMREEVKITREPYVQLSRQEQERRGLQRAPKRGAEAMGPTAPAPQPPAKMSRISGAGSGQPTPPWGAAPFARALGGPRLPASRSHGLRPSAAPSAGAARAAIGAGAARVASSGVRAANPVRR